MPKFILFICIGASAGAVMRWLLGLLLNDIFPSIPLGTLAANLIGGYCIGLALGFFNAFPHIAPEWRLMIITGFLGGLTTFSTFSAEISYLLLEQRLATAVAAIALHVCGSLLMTFMGIGTCAIIQSALK